MANDLTQTEDFIKDLVARAASTAWEAAGATGIVLWGGSGLSVAQLGTVSGLHKAFATVGIGVLASFASAFKTSAITYLRANRQTAETLAEADLTQLGKNMGREVGA